LPVYAPQRWMNCHKRTCSYCGDLWAGDTRALLRENLNDGHGQAVDMVTITAPGRDRLPHVDGPDGAVVEPGAAAAWNQAAPDHWSAMWHAAKYLMRRREVDAPVLLAYVIAYQRRGVIHYHLALAADSPQRRGSNRLFVGLLKGGADAVERFGARAGTIERKTVGRDGLAAEFGFGFVSLEAGRHGSKGVASYFGKYVAKNGESGKPEICETVQRVEVGRRRVVYVSSSLTARTRCTMRNLRRRRYWWRAHTCGRLGRGFTCREVELFDRLGFYVAFGSLLPGVELGVSARGSPLGSCP